ncbi:phage tail sheath C-terminal domain-containing protein [Microbacterium sp. C7(2022)]|uniref:phage tail sheath family protein n=1 Tax=Microbacterium sp. C7(2022) TaxID=2992759 RepID=UPI00237A4AED|nr:phage tail sheath C-terminal domain-containing protein [Microbacterium sp. C7(2022)]MDE0546859.1 phage tail sheath subtilisin-like domain-containing protein [Microbacterium sp. C7(2022)]
MSYQTPGVYVEEVPAEPQPIPGAPTSVTAFIGQAERPSSARLVTSLRDFQRSWPGDSVLGRAVEDYFANGGAVTWIAAVAAVDAHTVRRAAEQLSDDVSLVAVIADPPPDPSVIAAAAAGAARCGAMLLVEKDWADARAAHRALRGGADSELGAAGADVALYWPRLRRRASHAASTGLGAVAGVIASTDLTRGVWAAPAGRDARVWSAEPARTVSSDEQALLTPLGVNVIRHFPGTGTVLWGARTTASDPEWRYIAVRRTARYVERSVARGLDWTVFEPNDQPLWVRVRASVDAFLDELYRRGAFAGGTRDECFFVRCDHTVMTVVDRTNGRLIVEIGLALLRPAEFTVIRVVLTAARH